MTRFRNHLQSRFAKAIQVLLESKSLAGNAVEWEISDDDDRVGVHA